MTVGERIEFKRKEKNMTMEALAEKLGVGRSAVNKWEKGHVQRISRTMIIKMANIFDCDPAWLGGYSDNNLKGFDTPEEFELAWHRMGGGRHPITLSDTEHELVLAFRCADKITQKNILNILEIKIKKKNEGVI